MEEERGGHERILFQPRKCANAQDQQGHERIGLSGLHQAQAYKAERQKRDEWQNGQWARRKETEKYETGSQENKLFPRN